MGLWGFSTVPLLDAGKCIRGCRELLVDTVLDSLGPVPLCEVGSVSAINWSAAETAGPLEFES